MTVSADTVITVINLTYINTDDYATLRLDDFKHDAVNTDKEEREIG